MVKPEEGGTCGEVAKMLFVGERLPFVRNLQLGSAWALFELGKV